jgi:hypothetical protein
VIVKKPKPISRESFNYLVIKPARRIYASIRGKKVKTNLDKSKASF